MSTFITRLEHSGTGPRIAVKDLIDVRGVPTTAGCKAVAQTAQPARADAACLAGARAADAALVGKANLYELAFGASGTNQWYGTPVNPLDPALIPGGSSSGSAVAVADGDADYGYGTDTGGSVRIPAACCGLAGLKTTHGRISADGVWPLSPSLDTVGPICRDVAGLTAAMALLEPGFTATARPATRLGRLPQHRRGDRRQDRRRHRRSPGQGRGEDRRGGAARVAGGADAGLPAHVRGGGGRQRTLAGRPGQRGEDRRRGARAAGTGPGGDGRAGAAPHASIQARWQSEWTALLSSVDAVVLPTLPVFPPPLAEANKHHLSALTAPVNLAGLPALALPVPAAHELPASMQVVGARGGEEALLATGAVLAEAAGYRP